MDIEDPSLPAVVHLTGPGAADVLTAAVEHAGGTLLGWRMAQVQYRPEHDLVVRYRCDIEWAGGRTSHDTLLAGTARAGQLAGTVPVTAETDAGDLAVSVWRWPFDPHLPGLPVAVTAPHLAAALASEGIDLGPGTPEVDVVAYRPTERAVVRVRSVGGDVRYVKVVPPATAPALAERHRLLHRSGLPVPEVLAVDRDAGLLVLAELAGTTLRDRVKDGSPGWPDPLEFVGLFDSLASVPPDGLPRVPCRLRDAFGHAEMLRTVAPEHGPVLSRITGAIRDQIAIADTRTPTVVHGDLHEAQVVVDGGRVTGLLDIDDVGVGDPVTDRATLIAHLRFRALLTEETSLREVLHGYVDDLHETFRGCVPSRGLDVAVAAVLVGLATGPFRIQRTGWRAETREVLHHAADLVGELTIAG